MSTISKNNRKWTALFAVAFAGLVAVYIFWLRPLIPAFYNDRPEDIPAWLYRWVHAFYPRLQTEKYRFNLTFFINKADLVVIRAGLVVVGISVWAIFKEKWPSALQSFWHQAQKAQAVNWLFGVFYLGLILYTHDWTATLNDMHKLQELYKPPLIYKLLGLPYPAVAFIYGWYGFMIGASVLAAFVKKHRVITASVASFIFVLLQGYYYSFQKFDHTYTTFTFAALLLPFMALEYQSARKQNKRTMAAWPLLLIRLSVAAAYFMAGLEKITIGGLSWLAPDSFRAYLYLHPTSASQWAAQYDVVCVLIPLALLIFQFTFWLGAVFPKWRWYSIISGIAFHTGTVVLLDIGGLNTPWMFVYIFFLPCIYKKTPPALA